MFRCLDVNKKAWDKIRRKENAEKLYRWRAENAHTQISRLDNWTNVRIVSSRLIHTNGHDNGDEDDDDAFGV